MSVIVPNSGCDNSVLEPWQPCRTDETASLYDAVSPTVSGYILGFMFDVSVGNLIKSVDAPTVGVFV